MSIAQRRAYDFYPTPPEVIEALLDREDFRGEVWEPASGDHRIVDALKRRGIDAVGTDIQSGDDFFTTRRTPVCIITNPPYSHATEFVVRALELAESKVAMLLPLEFLSGIERFEKVWDSQHFTLKSLYVFSRRIKFTDGSPPSSHGWFVWERDYVGDVKIEHLLISRSGTCQSSRKSRQPVKRTPGMRCRTKHIADFASDRLIRGLTWAEILSDWNQDHPETSLPHKERIREAYRRHYCGKGVSKR